MMTTLYYCCLYHYDNEASQFCSPKYLIQRFQVSNAGLSFQPFYYLALIYISRS